MWRDILYLVIGLVGVYIIMIFISPKLAGVMGIIIFIVFIISFVFSKKIKEIFRKERACISDINTFLSENLSGMKLTQIFNQEKTKEQEFEVKNEALRNERFNVTKAFGLYRPTVSLIYNCTVALCFVLGIEYGL